MASADTNPVIKLYGRSFETGLAPSCSQVWEAILSLGGRFETSMLSPYRSAVIHDVGFGLPTSEAISAIAKLGAPVLEVGAGTGAWSYFLSKAGVDVVATDACLEYEGFVRGKHFPVLNIDAAEAVSGHPDRVVLMVWPPLGSTMAEDVADALEIGQTLAFQGEGKWSNCATDRFFENIDAAFETVAMIDEHATWRDLRDSFTIFRKVRETVPAFRAPGA